MNFLESFKSMFSFENPMKAVIAIAVMVVAVYLLYLAASYAPILLVIGVIALIVWVAIPKVQS